MRNTNLKKHLCRCFVLILMAVLLAMPASAAGLQDSVAYTGTVNLIADATLIATILCPTIAGLVAVVFVIRRSMADEQDKKMWMNKIWTAIICGVAGGLITGIISAVASYYSG